ncbi:MAG: aldo/keto reductase [Dehalococcoidia bacterium]|nr:aldo/keto reductase [Dehalococcoidia bacterium]
MQRRKYKNNDNLSIIGLGGISIKGLGKTKASEVISFSIDNGINYFDVAPGYGDAQELMGVGLLPYRKDVFLACKTKFRDLRNSQSDLENSLKLLKTNYFDLYQLHGMKTLDDFEKVTSKNGALKTLIEAKEKGLIRYLGFSCHSIKVAKLLINLSIFDSILFPVNWNLMIKENFGEEILKLCEEKNITVLALKSMAERKWKENENRLYKNCWYKPINDPFLMDLSIKFTLSKNVTSLIPPGDQGLYKKSIEIGKNYKKLSKSEYEYLCNLSPSNNPIGNVDEIFI